MDLCIDSCRKTDRLLKRLLRLWYKEYFRNLFLKFQKAIVIISLHSTL